MILVDESKDIKINNEIDELEAVMVNNFETIDCPLDHSFSPGFYIRQIFMPAGTLLTSLIHKTRHSYHVTKGVVKVKIKEGEWETIESGHVGITEPGTRRILYIESDCVWTTFHPILESEQPLDNSKEAKEAAVEMITDRIIERHINPFLGGVVRNNVLIKEEQETELLTQ